MPGTSHAVSVLVAACALLGSAADLALTAQQAPPVLRASVDLVTIDVQVTPAKGAAFRQLAAADFDIRISGQKRTAASVTFLHNDEGTVSANPGVSSPKTASSSDCVFGFHRKADRPTAHYVIGVERSEADKRDVKDVKVQIVDKAFNAQTYQWRSPVRQYNRSHPWPTTTPTAVWKHSATASSRSR